MATETRPVFNPKTGTSASRTYLSAREKFLLHSYIQQHYAESKLDDRQFAVQASKALNLDVSHAMISYARKEFEIPCNRVHTGGSQVSQLLSRIETLEAQMETLLRERREHFHGGRP